MLIEQAEMAQQNAYSPYSKFRVGAALLNKDGQFFRGANVENASYGATICAERSALCSAIGAIGSAKFCPMAICVVTDLNEPGAPCGICRQTLVEFGDMLVLLYSRPTKKLRRRSEDQLKSGGVVVIMNLMITLLLNIVHALLQLFLFVVTGGRRNILKVQRQHLADEKRSEMGDQQQQQQQQQQKASELYNKFSVLGEHRLSGIHFLLETDLDANPVTAEVTFWQWYRSKQIHILQKSVKVFPQSGAHLQLQCNAGSNSAPSDGFFNVLIRLLEKKEQKIVENPCPPCDVDDEFVLKVGLEQFTVSKHYLMSVSPVFHKMFSVDMLERAQGEVNLEETNAEEFSAFLEAISPKLAHPNPSTVMGLLKLADRFQVDSLRNRCEVHLINCVEMSLIERLLCSEVYRLEKLKNYILKSLSGVGMREFYEENQAALNLLSKDLLIQLTVRICASFKIDRSALCNNCAKNLNE
uniref:cytidine deaminase n=1 Tax=Globodera rostochiensis TaxID=31243 RepID=A0A914HUC8_GLORO